MAAPTCGHLTRIKRVIKYLMGVPVVRWWFKYQAEVGGLTTDSDSNWAAAESSYRSTTGGWLMHGI
eukprot:1233972-Amphidinium_carterae.1